MENIHLDELSKYELTLEDLEYLIKGNYSEGDVRLQGILLQMLAGFIGVDVPGDIRDLTYDITHPELSGEWTIKTLIDVVALIPVLGGLKYVDETTDLIKRSNNFIDGTKEVSKKILSYEEAEEIAFSAIHGSSNANAVVLGKYGDGGPTAYTSVAKEIDAQYFQLDNWDELASKYSYDEIWKINEKFLDIQTSSGRDIYLSHNPYEYIGGDDFYSIKLSHNKWI